MTTKTHCQILEGRFSKPCRRGFALVVTLSLMVLLSLLAIALFSLSSIEFRRNSYATDLERARANARMALVLAIGQLQQNLGPDRRINAPASQISSDSGESTSAIPGKQHWIGTYDSWDSVAQERRPAPSFRRWLVSGEDSVTTQRSSVTTETPTEDVVLFTGSAEDGSTRVTAPKVFVRSGDAAPPDGAYAWWVGDENSKALVARKTTQNTLAASYHHSQAAPLGAIGLNPELGSLAPDSPLLSLLASSGSLDLAASSPGVASKVFHDFTTTSLGVVADAARGGLKRDLSLFLDHPVSRPLAPKLPNTNRLYPNGITWEELWLYHNVWRALEPPARGLASMTGGSLANSLILQTRPGSGAASISAFRSDPYSIYKLPNFIRAQWIMSLWARERTTTPPKDYTLHWVTDGILTLWNPTDVPIALHPESYISYKFWNIPYDLRVFSGNSQVAGASFASAAGNGHIFTMIFGTAPSPYWGRYGTPDPVVLMPGEVLVMSEGPGSGGPIPYDNNQANRSLSMKAGWNLGRGRSRNMTLAAGTTIRASTPLRFEAVPNNDDAWKNDSQFNLVNQHYYYGADSRGNEPSNTLYDSIGGRIVRPSNRATAPNFPHVFPVVRGELPSADTMTGAGKHPFLMFSHQVKTEDSPTSWSRFHNPRALQAILTQLDGPELAMSGHEIVVKGLTGSRDSNMPQFSPTSINRGLFGGSYSDLSRGQDTVITQSIPREPPLSLGAFQHAIANGNTQRLAGDALRPNSTTFSRPEISHAISNSYALPVLAASATSNAEYQDHSYHANRTLWDSWFLSSIVQQQSPHHTEKLTARQNFENLLDPTKAHHLPNAAMRPWSEKPEEAVAALFSGSNAKPNAHELASSFLMLEGAFNVNSTSVEAWKSLIGSLHKAFMPVAGDPNRPGTMQTKQANEVAVQNLLTAFGTGGPNGADHSAFDGKTLTSASNKAQWRGYRQLSHEEVDALAHALVVEIRKRGPFLSLADFINRRAGNDKELALCGPLQAALDRTVNTQLLTSPQRVQATPTDAAFLFPEAAALAKSLAGPAHVMQADILTPIGSRLSARSDTFRIRAYGEALNRNGKVTARVWCEATVQRIPDYIDPSDPAHAAEITTGRTVPALASPLNKNFGRRFITTSFRWLSPSEIDT
jgi:hypothetical protein